jgi:hypothetical protein
MHSWDLVHTCRCQVAEVHPGPCQRLRLPVWRAALAVTGTLRLQVAGTISQSTRALGLTLRLPTGARSCMV